MSEPLTAANHEGHGASDPPLSADERVTYAPKVGVKCRECGRTFDAVKCPTCGSVDESHPAVRFGKLVGSGEP